jgi:hypothetical protein
MPTSPHWHDPPRLVRLIATNIAHAEDHGLSCPTVRDFVREFRGLSGTAKAKQICDAIDASGETLAAFHARGEGAAWRLLSEMKHLSRPVQPRDLGVIGRFHLLANAAAVGCDAETFEYRCAVLDHDGLPYLIETAFALRDDENKDRGAYITEGFNFTPAIGDSPFRLEGKLAQQMIDKSDPVIAFAHVASPRLEFLDRGKARVALPYAVREKLEGLIGAVTKRWRNQRKAEERHASAVARRRDAIRRSSRVTIREAAFAAMEEAYRIASANGSLPANARQVYYSARREILARTGRESIDSDYFTQTLLIDYVEENECNWDIAFDARGHLSEPHEGATVDLGTLAVRQYLSLIREPRIVDATINPAGVSTHGPSGCYGAVLFIEKEGFTAILERARIADRFDAAIMSAKGMSVTAARRLVDELAGRGVRLFVLHDFDISGFSIRKTLTESGRRHTFRHKLDFVDLGLRLADVERLALQSERVAVGGGEAKDAVRRRLRINGATEAEIEFLMSGRRVELNAMPSDVFVRFVEDGLRAHGVAKVVPDAKLIAEVYAAVKRAAEAEEALKAELDLLNAKTVETPPDLVKRVKDILAQHPSAPWTSIVAGIAKGKAEKKSGEGGADEDGER